MSERCGYFFPFFVVCVLNESLSRDLLGFTERGIRCFDSCLPWCSLLCPPSPPHLSRRMSQTEKRQQNVTIRHSLPSERLLADSFPFHLICARCIQSLVQQSTRWFSLRSSPCFFYYLRMSLCPSGLISFSFEWSGLCIRFNFVSHWIFPQLLHFVCGRIGFYVPKFS